MRNHEEIEEARSEKKQCRADDRDTITVTRPPGYARSTECADGVRDEDEDQCLCWRGRHGCFQRRCVARIDTAGWRVDLMTKCLYDASGKGSTVEFMADIIDDKE